MDNTNINRELLLPSLRLSCSEPLAERLRPLGCTSVVPVALWNWFSVPIASDAAWQSVATLTQTHTGMQIKDKRKL